MDTGQSIIKSQDTGTSILAVIARAASDPAVDVEKMERLLALQERMHERQAKAEYDQALSAAQSEMRPVSRDCHNPQTRSRYASYEAIDSAIRPIYTQHGFAMFFGSKPGTQPAEVIVTCRVSHRAGHSETIELPMPADGKGAKGNDVMTRTHATGSALSYGQRYLAKLVWNLSFGEADDDGNAAGHAPRPPQATASRQNSPAKAPETPPAPKAPPSPERLRDRLLANLAEFGERLNDYTLATFGCDPQEWPAENLPSTKDEMESLKAEIDEWLSAKDGLAPTQPDKNCPESGQFQGQMALDNRATSPNGPTEEWFWDVVVTMPTAGMKRDDYMKTPDTIGSLYKAMKAGDAKARTRLFGIAANYYPEERVVNGVMVQPTLEEIECRRGLDAFTEWHKAKH